MGRATWAVDANPPAEAELGSAVRPPPRGVDLTDAGVLFLERARVALSAADIAGATGRDLETGIAGSVTLGIATCACWGQTFDLLERFTRERSGVEVTVLEGYGGTLWRDLRNGRLDALLAPAPFSSGDLRRSTWAPRHGSRSWGRAIRSLG